MHDLSALVGADVRRIALDYQVTLFLADGPGNAERVSAILQVEAPIEVRYSDDVAVCDPNDKATHSAVLRVLHLVVRAASVDNDGALRLTFDDGTSLVVARDDQYESWNLTGKGVPEVLMGPP